MKLLLAKKLMIDIIVVRYIRMSRIAFYTDRYIVFGKGNKIFKV